MPLQTVLRRTLFMRGLLRIAKERIMDDAIFRALVDGNRLNLAYRIGLGDMWDDVAQTLGRRVTFMTSEQREAVR